MSLGYRRVFCFGFVVQFNKTGDNRVSVIQADMACNRGIWTGSVYEWRELDVHCEQYRVVRHKCPLKS